MADSGSNAAAATSTGPMRANEMRFQPYKDHTCPFSVTVGQINPRMPASTSSVGDHVSSNSLPVYSGRHGTHQCQSPDSVEPDSALKSRVDAMESHIKVLETIIEVLKARVLQLEHTQSSAPMMFSGRPEYQYCVPTAYAMPPPYSDQPRQWPPHVGMYPTMPSSGPSS